MAGGLDCCSTVVMDTPKFTCTDSSYLSKVWQKLNKISSVVYILVELKAIGQLCQVILIYIDGDIMKTVK